MTGTTDPLINAQAEIATRAPKIGSKWRHRNGSEYVVVDVVIWEEECAPAVVYTAADWYKRPADQMVRFARRLAVFLDGRFKEIG